MLTNQSILNKYLLLLNKKQKFSILTLFMSQITAAPLVTINSIYTVCINAYIIHSITENVSSQCRNGISDFCCLFTDTLTLIHVLAWPYCGLNVTLLNSNCSFAS